MIISDYIAIASFILAIVSIIYTCKTNTKRYELSEQFRKDILGWYKETVFIIMKIKENLDSNKALEPNKKIELLSQLSALIEYGRFYFPNSQKNTDKGMHKPLAYRGERNTTLSLLINIYDALKQPDEIEVYINKTGGILRYIEANERWFTSIIFRIVDPLRWSKNRSKLIDVVNLEEIPLSEYHSVAANQSINQ